MIKLSIAEMNIIKAKKIKTIKNQIYPIKINLEYILKNIITIRRYL